jgi:dTDP-4-amino-4,6-dideoxygalactose transaminase
MTPDTPSSHRAAIPFGRPLISQEERDLVSEVLNGVQLTQGPVVRRFEAAFTEFTGAPRAVAVSSCMGALHLGYLFLGLNPGDEVIVPAQTHVATAMAVELCGGRCVFVDSEPETGNIDLEQMEARITPRTRAISLVHFLGMPVDMERGRHRRLEACSSLRTALALGAAAAGATGLHGDFKFSFTR